MASHEAGSALASGACSAGTCSIQGSRGGVESELRLLGEVREGPPEDSVSSSSSIGSSTSVQSGRTPAEPSKPDPQFLAVPNN